MGFSFEATDGASGMRYSYEYALSGAASTTIINSVVPISADAPTANVDALVLEPGGTYTAAITLSEGSTDFDANDLTLINATATLTGSGKNYTATLTPAGAGDVSLSTTAGSFEDATGHVNTAASNVVTATFVPPDTIAPGVTLSSTTTSFTGAGSFDVTVKFDEEVSVFDASDVTVTNGSVGGVTGGPAIYVATINATGAGDVTVSVARDQVTDAAGNGNLASIPLVIANSSVLETQKIIAQFQQSRANQLLASQPGLTGFLSGTGSGVFNADVTKGFGTFTFANNPDHPVWVRLSGSFSNEGLRETEYFFGVIGSHFAVSPNLLIGGMLEYDIVKQDEGTSRIDGDGWLAGPYFVARVPEQEVYFEGRLLYGQTSNDISPLGTYTDNFDSERLLAQVKVSGVLTYGATKLIPSLQASYTTDDTDAYTDNLGNFIPEQGIELGQIELGMGFETPAPFYGGNGMMTLTGGVKGIGSFTDSSGGATATVPEYQGGRARIDLGLIYAMANGGQFVVDTYYDGIGASGFESYGAQIGYNLEF